MTEDDNKKKKRNKKKKSNNKNTTTSSNNNNNSGGETSSSVVSVTVDDNTNTTTTSSSLTDGRDDNEKLQNDAVLHESASPSEQSSLLEAERQRWLQKQATLEGTIRELQNANDFHVQKEADYEEAFKDLRKEHDTLLQKEVSLIETIRGLQNDMTSHLEREATLEERLRKLQTANDLYVQKEAGLETKFAQFQSEKNLWLEKEASLEDKNMHLEKEKESWNLKEAKLEERVIHLEKEKESWTLKEKSNSERISTLNHDVARLKAQVLELEESRNLRENQLKEKISSMQSHIENLEMSISSAPSIDEFTKLASDRENLNSQIDAAQELIERLITENAELVEKINELYTEPRHQSGAVGVSRVPGADGALEHHGICSVDHAPPESNKKSGEPMESLEVLINDERTNGNHVSSEHYAAVPNSSESRESGKIVQIPLDDIEVGGPELQITSKDEKPVVQFSDAPLTGAPFRLISYFTRYVSGADLAEKNSSESKD